MIQRNKSFILIFTFYCNWKAHKYQPTQTEFALAAVRNKRLSVLDLQNVRTVSSTSTTVWVLDCRLYCHVPKYACLILPAVKDYLESRSEKKPSTQKTMELLKITQENNYFKFGEQMFQQAGGTSIGKKHAPSLCCLGAGRLEEEPSSEEYYKPG
jgi:hypothetical protein